MAVAEFTIVEVDEFPTGLRCATCERDIEVGMPYGSVVTGILADDVMVAVLRCVYCCDGG